jgi:hypothetical protein
MAAHRVPSELIEHGLIRAGSGPFSGVVRFDLRELADWAASWAPAPVTVTDVDCVACGRRGIRLVKEGETVTGEAVHCSSCENAHP